MNVKDKVIVITGAGGGLGSEMARLLCKNGAKVVILDLDAEKGQATADEIVAAGQQAWFFRADVTSEADWKAAVEFAVEKGGRLDVLVNNAGINIRKPVEEMSIDEWCTMMKVNTGSTFLGCKYAIPVMRRQGGGAIINTSSVCGLVGHKYTPEAYTASKGAVTMLTKAIASRYAGTAYAAIPSIPAPWTRPWCGKSSRTPSFTRSAWARCPWAAWPPRRTWPTPCSTSPAKRRASSTAWRCPSTAA